MIFPCVWSRGVALPRGDRSRSIISSSAMRLAFESVVTADIAYHLLVGGFQPPTPARIRGNTAVRGYHTRSVTVSMSCNSR